MLHPPASSSPSLPDRSRRPAPKEQNQPVPRPHPVSSKSILLVDDDEAVRVALYRVLTLEGWRVQVADDGEHALDLLQDHEYDLMITDLRMGAVSGWDLLFHETLLRPHMTIFVISALPPNIVGGAEHTAAEFFQKPVDIDSLLGAIHRYLGDGRTD